VLRTAVFSSRTRRYRYRLGRRWGEGAAVCFGPAPRGYPVGRDTDRHIAAAARGCERVVLAWGVHAAHLKRPGEVLELLRSMGIEPHCLRLTASGHPEHPLRLPAGCGLVRFVREVGKVE
jgi:hypothetical protein